MNSNALKIQELLDLEPVKDTHSPACLANNKAEHPPRAAGQRQTKAPSNVGSPEEEKQDFSVAEEKWQAQHGKPNRQERNSTSDFEDFPRQANRQHVYLVAKPEARVTCLTSPEVEVQRSDKPPLHSSTSLPLESSETHTVLQRRTPLSQGGAAGIKTTQCGEFPPLAQPQLSGKHLKAELNQPHYVNQSKRNGIDNQAFEIEEDNVTDSNSFQEKRKKGLGSYLSHVSKPINATEDYIKTHAQTFKYILLGVLGAGYVAYFIAACVLNFQRAIALVVLTTLAVVFKSYELLKKYKGDSISEFFSPAVRCFNSNLRWIKWVFMLAALVLLLVWLVLDTSQRLEQLISFGGVCLFIFLVFLFSSHRSQVSWRPVLWGVGIQFCMGIFVIRTQPGLAAFDWLGNQVKIFLEYTKAGSSFVFGDLIDGIFAFTALPIVVFFSSVMSILYFLGIMQWLILKISWLMQITMGTSPTETLSVAGNIFVGQTEAPLLIRPYLKDMTKSEIHAVMVGGFATIAGSVMGTFILFGIDPASLISASVMAAPCALAISKLSYPETEESQFKADEDIKIAVGDEKNILEAASSGASASIGLVANIAANLIAFLAILAFINEALSWLGGMVGYPSITFQLICSYVFMPVAFMMGVPYEDSFVVAELLGVKLFINEFVAYEKLSELKNNRIEGLDKVIEGQTKWISIRAEIISTYALCGFANFSSLGIVIGGLSAICPTRRSDISSLVFRAMIVGTTVSLINACIAGILFVPPMDCVGLFSVSDFNGTDVVVQKCCQELFKSTVNNGTVSFVGMWNTVANVSVYFSNCCQCCGLSNGALCV